jgi:hypothetical protein
MPKNTTYSELLSQLVTSRDVNLLRQELEALQAAAYKVKKDSFAEALKTSVRAWVAEWMTAAIKKDGTDPQKFIDGLLAEIQQLPVVEITIAFEPTQANIERIHNQVVTAIGHQVLIDLKTDQSLIAGATLSVGGKYHDGSQAQKLDSLLTEAVEKYL